MTWKTQPGYQQFCGHRALGARSRGRRELHVDARDAPVPDPGGRRRQGRAEHRDRQRGRARRAHAGARRTSRCHPTTPAARRRRSPTNPMANKWVRYPTLPADANTGFPGNTFAHASLLRPANETRPRPASSARRACKPTRSPSSSQQVGPHEESSASSLLLVGASRRRSRQRLPPQRVRRDARSAAATRRRRPTPIRRRSITTSAASRSKTARTS